MSMRNFEVSAIVRTGCELVMFAPALDTSAPGSMKRAVMVPSNGACKISYDFIVASSATREVATCKSVCA